jgi:hypothetical protein
MKVYLDRAVAISQAVKREPKKKWYISKLGANPVIAYDESKRMLIVVSVPVPLTGVRCNNTSTLEFD